jgi:N-acetylglutamate synthase-like GNAT family acetyltransferase
MSHWSISNDLSADEIDIVFRWISRESYWAKGIPRSVFERALAHSLCFALRDETGTMKGFARTVTDRATFAYLADVFIDTSERGRGAGKSLLDGILNHPELQDLRRWILATKDAHSLYAQFGFAALPDPSVIMVRNDPDIYARLGHRLA